MKNHFALPSEEIKHSIEIFDVISEAVDLKAKGRYFVGICPFHSERIPSFCVYPETQSFYCFGCAVGGDVIAFVMLRDNVDFRTALKILAARAGIETSLTPQERQALLKARRKREQVRETARRLEAIIEEEWLRLIGIERDCCLFLRSLYHPDDLDLFVVRWALHTRGRVGYYLDRLCGADPKERLAIVLESRGWMP